MKADLRPEIADAEEWLVGGASAGGRIRSLDCSATPLGPRELWSPVLRSSLQNLLASQVPMALLWGEALLLLPNDGFLQAAGLGPDRLARPARDLWPTDVAWEAVLAAVMGRGESVSGAAGGHDEASFSPVRADDGSIAGILLVLGAKAWPAERRSTRRPPLRLLRRPGHGQVCRPGERACESALDVLEHGEACCVLDEQFRILYVNRAQEERSGTRRSEALGRAIWDTLPPASEQQPRWTGELRRVMRERVPASCEEMDADGIWTETKAYPTGDGGVALFFQDITARRRAEEALREADRRKDEFLAILSHELRNPLAPIGNSLYVLDHAEAGSPQARRARSVIERQVRHMTRLVEDLLDVTRISRGKVRLQRERVDIAAIARRVVDDQRELFDRNGVALELAAPVPAPHVLGDPTRLAQVVGNLLQNAAKFTPRGGQVRLEIDEPDPASVLLRVSDDGAGIPADTLAHVFEPFVQEERTLERSRGGLGLGLALTKRLVDLHGGTVSAASEGPGKGAQFTVRLPADRRSRPRPVAARAQAPSPSRRVLVIEDNVDAAETLQDALELGGHQVEIAFSGPAGLEKARALRPQVVLCDIGLPLLDGYAVARAIRCDPLLASTYLVALSGYALPEDVERSREAGFDRHVVKPPELAALQELLAGPLERSRPASPREA